MKFDFNIMAKYKADRKLEFHGEDYEANMLKFSMKLFGNMEHYKVRGFNFFSRKNVMYVVTMGCSTIEKVISSNCEEFRYSVKVIFNY